MISYFLFIVNPDALAKYQWITIVYLFMETFKNTLKYLDSKQDLYNYILIMPISI